LKYGGFTAIIKDILNDIKEAIKTTIQQKIEVACSIAGINQSELAKRLNTTAPAWNQRLKTGKFSDDDFIKIADAIGCKYKSGFYFSDGNKVE